METVERVIHDLMTVMELQIQGMAAFQDQQLLAHDALTEKSWPLLEKSLRTLDFQAEGLRCLEERRHALWTELQMRLVGRDASFAQMVPSLPQEHVPRLTQLRQKLQLQVLSLRGLSEGLASYVNTASSFLRAVVQEIQPHLKGRIYGRTGTATTGASQPLVLNTRL